MLSCSRVISQFSKITRQINSSYINQHSTKIIGGISVRHASDKKNKKAGSIKKPISGTTLKAEECIPPKYPKASTIEKKGPACEMANSSCPPCDEICGPIPPRGPNDGPNYPKYWKEILAALILTGASVYTFTKIYPGKETDSSDSPAESKKKREKIKRKPREKVSCPKSSLSIPPEVPYLLIGGGTAAFSAFRSIKSRDPKAKVLVITEEPDLPYMRPPLSKELWYNKDMTSAIQLNFRQWNGTERSVFYEPPEFYSKVENLMDSDKGGVAVATGWKVKSIDPFKKLAILEDGYEIMYDKCLIATGASPKNLPIFETADETIKSKILPFRTKEDFLDLEDRLSDPKVNNIVVVGGGFLGSELASSLASNFRDTKKRVYQIFKEKSIMSQVLPAYLSEWTTKRTTMEGVNCIPNSEIQGVEMKNGQLNLVLTGGKKIQADQVIVAVGVEANTELAKASHLEVNPEIGGFLVNAELEARSDLWVAGDAACFYDVRLGRRRVEHHDHAVISGRLAGENMTGAGKPYLHQSMFWSDLGPEVGYEAIGIIDSSLPTVGIFAKPEDDDAETLKPKNEDSKLEVDVKSQLVSEKAQSDEKNIEGQTEKKDINSKENTKSIKIEDNYEKGVIFYLKDDIVTGILLWNVFNRMSIARKVLARGTKYDDLNEVAKLFTIHED